MRFGSVCSGIEAASVAWNPIGWESAWFAEIEQFPCAVLKHHYPEVPNYGDMTKFKEWNAEPIDLLCGGTPCQSFSVAGLRKGLDDPRGNLMLTFGAIADHFRPKWFVWGNVPGVLSSNGGRDFGSFLWMLGQLGYGFAYRVLDAQYFGVPQRRRRVFVVGCLGDWRSAAAVLFERDILQGNPAPSRKTGQEVAGTISSRTTGGGGLGTDFDLAGGLQRWPADMIPQTAQCLTTGTGLRYDPGTETILPAYPIPIHDKATRHAGHSQDRANADGSGNGLGIGAAGDPMYTITTGDKHAVATTQYGDMGELVNALTAHATGASDAAPCVAHTVAAFKPGQSASARSIGYEEEVAPSLEAGGGGNNKPALHVGMSVRRLTPTECERLQGFPDGYTNIPWRGKQDSPDGPRYKALGNSWAVPVVRWIGERINQVEQINGL